LEDIMTTNKRSPDAAKDTLELFRQIATDPLLAAARELDQAMEHTRRAWVLHRDRSAASSGPVEPRLVILALSRSRRRRLSKGEYAMTTDKRSSYVLYIEHDDRPHDVSVHAELHYAEIALEEFGADYLRHREGYRYGGLVAPSEELIDLLAEFGEYARIYKCDNEECDANGSVEVKPFKQSESEAA
jgi:hypothetical protein